MERFDTVIVGGGSAGGILARRLTEDSSHTVLVIEAGPDFLTAQDLPPDLRDPRFPQLSAFDWGQTAFPTEAPSRAPEHYPRGKVAGGSSTTNGTVAMRGLPADYDKWASFGNRGWGWADVLPTFVGMEQDLDFTGPYHGVDGPIPISRWPEETWPPLLRAVRAELVARGVPVDEDQNAPDATGFGPIARNQLGEFRGGSLLAYLVPARARPNLTVVSEALATGIDHRDGRATGVGYLCDGTLRSVTAGRVILCAGVFRSPQLLMLSGIGNARDLRSTGIRCRLDLPGVGANLMDHSRVPLVVIPEAESGQRGMLAELRTTSSLGLRNDLGVSISAMSQETIDAMDFGIATMASAAMLFSPAVTKPRSRGWVQVTSADPCANPTIHLNMLADLHDVVCLREITRLTAETLLAPSVVGYVRQFVLPSPEQLADDKLLDEWIFESVKTAYHGSGTCRMGHSFDPMAVVDDKLRVHGIENLYVVDASVMPEIPCHYTGLTTYMIAEHAASWLRTGPGS